MLAFQLINEVFNFTASSNNVFSFSQGEMQEIKL